jgi:hypothetical protein
MSVVHLVSLKQIASSPYLCITRQKSEVLVHVNLLLILVRMMNSDYALRYRVTVERFDRCDSSILRLFRDVLTAHTRIEEHAVHIAFCGV